MPLKNGNTVGVERRMDLASLFCMIGWHGPAVALAAIAMVSVLAGIIIYLRGKRRKATAAAADGDGTSPGAERDASVIRQPSPEESHSSVESTDASDEGSSDVKEDVEPIQSDLKIRHRRAAPAAKTPPPYSPPESDIQVPDNKHTTSDDTEEVAVVWDSYEVAETHAEEANQSLQSDAYAEAETVLEDAVDSQNVLEEVQYNDSCLNDEPINDENHEEEEKVLKAECPEDEEVTTDGEVSDKTTREEENNFQCDLNNPVCFEQMSQNTNGVGSNSEEPVIHLEDAAVPCVCHGKDEFEEENPDGIYCSRYSSNNHLSPEEEDKKNESEEAEEECLTADSHDDGLSGATTDAKAQISGIADFPDLSLDCQHPQNEDQISPSLDVDTVSTTLGPQMSSHETENQPETDGNGTTVELAEEHNGQVYDPLVQSCYEDKQNVQMTRNEAVNEASIAAAPDIVVCDGENITTPVMAEVFHNVRSVAADPDTVENVTASEIVEETPHLPFICQDQQSDHMENNETLDEARVDCATDPDSCNNDGFTALLMSEEISCPEMLSYSQNQQSDGMKNYETFDGPKVNSATDAPAGNNATITPLMMSELSHPDMSSYQDQQNERKTKKIEDFSEVTTGAAPVMTGDINPPMCQIHLPSFEQFEVKNNDISVAGSVGEESGISSMTVSPDAGKDFDVISENMVLPVMDCDLQAQNSLFADDAAISVIKEDMAGLVFRPYTSRHSQPSHNECKGWTNYESVAVNEDIFGHEIHDSYHRVMDQFTAQVADSVTSFTDELEKQSDVKVVEEVKEKKAVEGVEKKEETKAEKEKEEDYEKTEISIMEATMDHNEWIMDGTYQALPWMNLSAPSFAQDHTKINQVPTEECQHSSTVTDHTTCVDADIPASTEVKQTSLVDESTENNKKVVAVQPMPQNVNVTFRVHYVTQSPYQSVSVTGNQQELGNWKGFIPLERAKDEHWVTVVSLPAESHVEWKFVVVDKGEVCRWEECGNRLLDTGYGDDLLVHKCWGRL